MFHLKWQILSRKDEKFFSFQSFHLYFPNWLVAVRRLTCQESKASHEVVGRSNGRDSAENLAGNKIQFKFSWRNVINTRRCQQVFSIWTVSLLIIHYITLQGLTSPRVIKNTPYLKYWGGARPEVIPTRWFNIPFTDFISRIVRFHIWSLFGVTWLFSWWSPWISDCQ